MSDDGRVRTVGKQRMGPLGAPFTAHPKVDPTTGAYTVCSSAILNHMSAPKEGGLAQSPRNQIGA